MILIIKKFYLLNMNRELWPCTEEMFFPRSFLTCIINAKLKAKHTSIDKYGNEVELEIKGRHDPCVGIRAVPIAEAMVNLVLIDHLLRNKAQCGDVDQKLPFVTE